MPALDQLILRIASSHGPIGQGALTLLLRREGLTVSPPTVGRRLQTLEFDGLLRKVSVDGRVITERGGDVLRRWEAEARLRGSGDALLETLKRGDKKHILDLLAARRAIECETAALAAQHATTASLRRMADLLDQQASSIDQGGLGIEHDVAFHLEIARAARNEVLHSLVSLLRNHGRYDLIITSMRTIVGSRLVVEHAAILDAIKAKNPNAARRAMDYHIGSLQRDLEQYLSQRRRRAAGAAEG
ncbi:MAG: FadR/GntR family transcriptional regulator [bacterium]